MEQVSPPVLPGGVGLFTELERVLHTRGMVGSAEQALALKISLVREFPQVCALGWRCPHPWEGCFLWYPLHLWSPVKATQMCHLLEVVLTHTHHLGVIPCPSETLEL